MILAASVIVRDELSRYLALAIPHLLTFCDEVSVLDDGSTDGTSEWLNTQPVRVLRLNTERDTGSDFLSHAAKRNQLLQFTLETAPDYVLAIDADEFVTEPAAIRFACETGQPALSLTMREVWSVWDDCLCVREDGGWRSHEVAMLWSPRIAATYDRLVIKDNGPATGRTPALLDMIRSYPTGSAVLHMGWANKAERDSRYARYATHDGGRYHNAAHLQSIMWLDSRIHFDAMDWPEALLPIRDELLEIASSDLSDEQVRKRFCLRHLNETRA